MILWIPVSIRRQLGCEETFKNCSSRIVLPVGGTPMDALPFAQRAVQLRAMLKQQMNADNRVKAQKVLEINTEHPIFEKLQALYTDDPTKIFDYAELLYDQALLIEGLPVEDPVRFSNLICELM